MYSFCSIIVIFRLDDFGTTLLFFYRNLKVFFKFYDNCKVKSYVPVPVIMTYYQETPVVTIRPKLYF